MADLTWYSREGADQRFLTKTEGAGLATKAEVTRGDAALGGRLDAVEATAGAALPSTTAASTYATKAEVEAVKQSIPQAQAAPDLSGYATKAEMQAADGALGQRIDTVSGVASAAATKAELAQYATTTAVSSTYATKEALSGYLKSADAADTYATKAALAQAQLGGGQAPDLSGFATKAEVHQADSALGVRIDQVKATADGALPKAEASAKYATKEDLKGYLTSTAAGTTYATKSDLAEVRSAIPQVPPAPDLSGYLRSADAASTYATKAALADYVTRSDADQLYVSNDDLQRELGQKASLTDLNDVTRRVDSLGTALSPFKPGERYYSPVTYFWPDYYEDGKPGKTSKWAQILKFAGSLGIVILNRNSGNWDEFNVDFKKQAELALAAGAKRAVFYVKTQYLSATLPAGDPGRTNVPNVDKYTPDYILGQIDKAKTQYGDVCQGVFLDETINGWGAQAGRIPAYRSLIDKIRAKYGKDFLIVVNSGSNISEDMCKLDFDVCMMFEKDATAFLNEDPGTPILPDHMKAYPSTRWWAVVHGVTSENYQKVFDKANKLGIAHLYITDGQLREDPQQGGQWEPVGNPYANPPSSHILELVVPWLKGYLPLKLEVDDLRSRPKVLSLGKHEAVPAGTPAGTIIVRKDV
nr:MAG TPA: Spherulation-specific family 4 [Caudoviricetes sp.]